MNPNQNVVNPVVPRPTAPVTPSQVAPTTPEVPSLVEAPEEKKSGKGVVVALVLFIILAIGGIGFGVWAFMDGNAQKNGLNEQITSLKAQNAELLEKIDGGDITINVDTDSDVDTADYIYVGEWGIKIKIPETLGDVSYGVDSWNEENFAGTSLCVTGATTGHDGIPSFIKPMLYGGAYVCLGKNTKSISEENGGEGNQTWPVGEFYIDGPQDIVGDESDKDWELESVETIKAMLSDENNRSAI